jgi:hypothetical protein
MVHARVRAVWDMSIPEIREYAGVHDYDGTIMDLSPSAIAALLGRLPGAAGRAPGDKLGDRHDESHLAAAEDGLRAGFEIAKLHRWNPLPHVANLDLACYDREYAPLEDRLAAKAAHLAKWPEAIEASLESLDEVPAPVAMALQGAVAGLAEGIDDPLALAAHARLLERIKQAAAHGTPDVALGGATLARLLGDGEGMPVDLGRLEETADAERNRLVSRLHEDCERLSPGTPPGALIRDLIADHPDDDGIYAAARVLIEEATAFTLEHGLLPELGGTCLVGPAPASRRWVVAMMSWTGAYEADAPAWYYVNPPDESWTDEAKSEWRSMFSATTLPAITVHEVTPGHYAHGRMVRLAAKGDVRRSLHSEAFVEGWAHYTEELMVEVGFRKDDPRFAIGVWMEALTRVTRFAAALGVHNGTMSIDEATRRFEEDAFLLGPAARSEAARAAFDPTYGRYTWGKLEILALRDQAIASWGNRFSLLRFHSDLLALGAPPLGTMGDAIEP